MNIAQSTPPGFSDREAMDIATQHYSMEIADASSLGSFIDQNFLISTVSGDQFVLKIHAAEEQRAVLDLQNKTAQFLSEHIPSVRFPVAVHGNDGDAITAVTDAAGVRHYVRLLSYIPGQFLKDLPEFSDQLLADIGAVLGNMDHTLQGFTHVAANRPDIPWDLKNAGQTKQLCRYISDPHRRRLAEYFFLQFDMEVADQLAGLRKSVVHNDCHRYSLLVADSHKRISGVIDFGDTVYSQTVSNLAISLSDIMVQCEDPIASAAIVTGAYHQQFALTEEELGLLYYLICTRLSIYGCMSAYSAATSPENEHAQLKTDQVWSLLERLLAINPLAVEDQFRGACQLPFRLEKRRQETEHNLDDRQQHFPASLYTHYQEPISLHKGALQYLYDNQGKTYLDCVNNVCQWGHCHPRIARAAQQQIAGLNTNSRYLYPQMTEYAEKLLATFDERLDVCFLVNSGSEANDLALRLARTFTGNTDVLVIDKAYHGNSSICTDISPNRIDREGGPGLPDYVHSVLIPDTFRGPFKAEEENVGAKYAADVDRVVGQLAEQGRGVAAFYAESLVGTGGQIVLPEGYLQAAYASVRAAGGVCVADEVQVGFGRTGDQLWCYESQQVVPDIVTLGKPIGNGHPMAAVITRREIAEAFDNGVTYFNTFGGNPVSCATGLAVLEVLQDEALQDNARDMSGLLFDGLRALAEKYSLVADVRGQGLYIGVELMHGSEPATAEAKKLVEFCKSAGVLFNTNGYDNNIIKIKPPLIINRADIDKIITTLEQALAAL